jgi:hypothetical protein
MAPELGGTTVLVVAGATGPISGSLVPSVVLAMTRSIEDEELLVPPVVVTELDEAEAELEAIALIVLATPAIVVTDVTDSAESLRRNSSALAT